MTSTSGKITTKENAVVVVPTSTKCEALDEVGYLRCMESLLKEIKRSHPREDIIRKLLELTYEGRRQKINGTLVKTTTLLEEYPFFKWVSN